MTDPWDRVLPEHYGKLIAQLGSAVSNYRIASADIGSVSQIRLVSGQRKFLSGLVYIGMQKQFEMLSSAHVYSGSAIICCGTTHSVLADNDGLFNITVIEVSCSVATVFNTLAKLLAKSTYVPPMDVRDGLLRTWDRIMNSKLVAHQDIMDALSHSGLEPLKFFRVSLVGLPVSDLDIESGNQALISLRERLDDLLPHSEIFIYNRGLVILTFEQERQLQADLPYPELEQLLTKYGSFLMVGQATRNYSVIRTVYLICQRSLDIAMNLTHQGKTRIFRVDEYTMYYALDMCAQRCAQVFGHMDILLLVHPSIVTIRRYDIVHGGDLLEVMASYIRNSGSISKTAKELFVHRNTVNNRIAKLKTLLPPDFDLDNGNVRQLLLYSYQALKYYEEFLHFEVRKE